MFGSECKTDGFIVPVIPCLTVFCFSDCCSDWFDVIVNIPPALSQTCFFHTFNHNTEVLGFTSLVSLSGLVFVFGVCGGVLFSLGVFWGFFL